jgi:hypothetical protein
MRRGLNKADKRRRAIDLHMVMVRARRQRAAPAAKSWWTEASREGFTAAAGEMVDRMNNSKGAVIAGQLEALRSVWQQT